MTHSARKYLPELNKYMYYTKHENCIDESLRQSGNNKFKIIADRIGIFHVDFGRIGIFRELSAWRAKRDS